MAIIQEDFWHQAKRDDPYYAGRIFGENYASAGSKILPVGIKAAENSEVLFLDYERYPLLSALSCRMTVSLSVIGPIICIRIMSANGASCLAD